MEQKIVIDVATDNFFKKRTSCSVTMAIKLLQKCQYVHLTAYGCSFYPKSWAYIPNKSVF